MVSLVAEAAPTAIELDVALAKLPLLKAIVMLVAILCDRLVNVTTPFTAV